MIDPRRPNFASPPAARPLPAFSLSPDCLAHAGLTLLLHPHASLEPGTVEKLAWYLATHPDAAAATCFHVHTADAGPGRLDTANARDLHAFLTGAAHLGVLLARTASLTAAGLSPTTDPSRALLTLSERDNPCGTIPEFLCWFSPGVHDGFAPAVFPRIATGQFPPHPRTHSLPFEAVPTDAPIPGPTPPATSGPRALLIVPWFTMGGADKFNLRLTQQLLKRGWSVSLAATNTGDQSWLPDFTALTPDIFILPHVVRPDSGPLFLRRLIESRRPEIVLISNSELGYLCLPYLRLHCPSPAYVDYSHMEEPRWKNGGWSRYGAGWHDHLELNIVTSQHLKRWMVSRHADDSRVEVCTINEDPDLWAAPQGSRDQTRARLGIRPDQPVILYAARLCEQKQPLVFAATIRALRDRGVDFVALTAGDGPDRQLIEEYVATHRLTAHVRFLLAVPAADMPAVYAASDVLFLPSDREGIALVIFEAMASGLPVVGAAVGGQPELVTPDCGILFPRADPATETRRYADALASLIADPARRSSLGEAGRRRINSQFSLDAMGDRMTALFAHARELARTHPRSTVSPRTAQELATLAVEYLRADRDAPPPSQAVPLRYRIADNLNLALKRMRLSAPLKRAVLRIIDRRQPH